MYTLGHDVKRISFTDGKPNIFGLYGKVTLPYLSYYLRFNLVISEVVILLQRQVAKNVERGMHWIIHYSIF